MCDAYLVINIVVILQGNPKNDTIVNRILSFVYVGFGVTKQPYSLKKLLADHLRASSEEHGVIILFLISSDLLQIICRMCQNCCLIVRINEELLVVDFYETHFVADVVDEGG